MQNFTIQTSPENYAQFIKDVQRVQKIFPEYDDATRDRVRGIIAGSQSSPALRVGAGLGGGPARFTYENHDEEDDARPGRRVGGGRVPDGPSSHYMKRDPVSTQ